MPVTAPLDAPLLSRTDDALARPLPSAITRARADIVTAARRLGAIPESELTRPWAWIGGGEEEVRYGAYRAAEALESAEIEARRRVAADEPGERQAARIIGPATAARWALHGVLLPLADADLDADPGSGEWTIRQTLGHTISGQRAYAWGSAWWLEQARSLTDTDLPERVPEDVWITLPDELTTEAEGTLEALRARLDAIVDLSAERLAGLPDDRLALAARWSGFAVPLGFRLGRWSSHIREHTIQVDKTLAMLGRAPSEPARLVRHVLSTYGAAEAVAFGRTGASIAPAAERLAVGAAEARAAIESAAEAAEAAVTA